MSKKLKAFICVDPETLIHSYPTFTSIPTAKRTFSTIPQSGIKTRQKRPSNSTKKLKIKQELHPVKYSLKNADIAPSEHFDIQCRVSGIKEVDDFKRRVLPFYFLQYDRSDYPTFHNKIDIPMAFLVKNKDQVQEDESQVKNTILLKINLQAWKDQLKTKKTKKKPQKGSNMFIIELN